MLKGMQLALLIGPAVPIPVSQEIIDALTEVEVATTADEKPSTFRLTFSISTRSPLHTVFLLQLGVKLPLVRVVLYVTINGRVETLIDGVMVNYSVAPGADNRTSLFTIIGEDLTRIMDYIDFSGIPYPAMPAEARVLLMLAKYAIFGVIPLVIPSILIDVPIPVFKLPGQRGTDLQYIRFLANRVGYTFYVEPTSQPGISKAYWGPLLRVSPAQPALNVDMDAHSNVDGLNFAFDADGKLPVLYILNQETHVMLIIPVPDITPLNPPLGLIPAIPKDIKPVRYLSKFNPVQAALIGIAKAAKASTGAVSAKGSLDVLRYGHILKARSLVGVRGVGTAFDGLYYVQQVTHHIKRGEYRQDFMLARNGLISTVQEVPT